MAEGVAQVFLQGARKRLRLEECVLTSAHEFSGHSPEFLGGAGLLSSRAQHAPEWKQKQQTHQCPAEGKAPC